MGHNDEIVLERVRISTLEMIIEDIQVRDQADTKSLLGKIRELKNHKGGPQDTRLDPCHLKLLFRIQPRDVMAPKRTSTSAAPAMTQAAIRILVADSVAVAIETQAATMATTKNTNRNTRQRETRVARKCSYKEFMSCQPFNFKGIGCAIGLICWFKRTESVFARNNCIEDCKVKFATGNDLKTYVRRFQELAVLCPTMVPNSEKLMKVFIGGLPRRSDKSFVSISLASILNIPPITLDTTYDIEMADGNLVGTNTIIQCCTLILLNQPFEIDLMSIKLGSFDVVIGMDWLSKYHARIICDDKVIHIPIDGETLIIQAQVMEKKSNERRPQDIPVVREFLEVFPEDLPGLPPVRQVEFQINLIPGAAPVARASYRLGHSEMQKLSNQLQGLADIDYDYEIRYHPGKANVVADALTPTDAIKEENIKAENLRGIDKAFEVRPDRTQCIKNQSWLPLFDSIRIDLPRSGSGTYMASGRISFEELWVFGKAAAGAISCE
uniref:Putative reverse transcriptase domain-containing protein n=1 Tax=Tanacetum cinerariifolium TaxID=118510 RepID=A0A6L2KAU5_TANCI|nr:putative reverse transcriptase domain-containing protein [Tanacetum cinerariifolium]